MSIHKIQNIYFYSVEVCIDIQLKSEYFVHIIGHKLLILQSPFTNARPDNGKDEA